MSSNKTENMFSCRIEGYVLFKCDVWVFPCDQFDGSSTLWAYDDFYISVICVRTVVAVLTDRPVVLTENTLASRTPEGQEIELVAI